MNLECRSQNTDDLFSVVETDLGPDYMVSFSPGWNFAPPTGLKYCYDYMHNFSPGTKRKFPWESLLRCENTVNAHARVPFSARAEIPFRLHGTFSDFEARLAGLNTSPCDRQLGFQGICFRTRAEISARDEIRHVIRPLGSKAESLPSGIISITSACTEFSCTQPSTTNLSCLEPITNTQQSSLLMLQFHQVLEKSRLYSLWPQHQHNKFRLSVVLSLGCLCNPSPRALWDSNKYGGPKRACSCVKYMPSVCIED